MSDTNYRDMPLNELMERNEATNGTESGMIAAELSRRTIDILNEISMQGSSAYSQRSDLYNKLGEITNYLSNISNNTSFSVTQFSELVNVMRTVATGLAQLDSNMVKLDSNMVKVVSLLTPKPPEAPPPARSKGKGNWWTRFLLEDINK